ncbi:hypothetical protein RISK_005314 [Rhodopirellula islandica]|uniref:Uncharacterized protein n=1 Tax=Rhodopirellula islandica TaxID=595434 RepID=A0A0J1B6M6_RHOIS|nr:hypothetical protein RISK_005314 [Rhodopirellula islandica]
MIGDGLSLVGWDRLQILFSDQTTSDGRRTCFRITGQARECGTLNAANASLHDPNSFLSDSMSFPENG